MSSGLFVRKALETTIKDSEIYDRLRDPPFRDQLELVQENAWNDLPKVLLERNPDIVHFIGDEIKNQLKMIFLGQVYPKREIFSNIDSSKY
jgi:hypothetical protein